MRRVLLCAAVYNLLWGAFVVCFPLVLFRWAKMEPPNYPEIWQCVGMIVGVYGVGYGIAAFHPLRHWPIVLVGLLGKLAGPLGMAQSIWQGRFPLAAAWLSLTNDLIWWVPFTLILWRAYQAAATRRGWKRDNDEQ